MNCWKITGKYNGSPPQADWRADLASRLGTRPRRIGVWAELALYGALRCMDDAGESVLPNNALLSIDSAMGPATVLLDTLKATPGELPMPISFLQSQPGLLLPVLAQHLHWSGNGRIISVRGPLLSLRLACLETSSPSDGVLVGWVEEATPNFPGGISRWLRIIAIDTSYPENIAALEEQSSMEQIFNGDISAFTFQMPCRCDKPFKTQS